MLASVPYVRFWESRVRHNRFLGARYRTLTPMRGNWLWTKSFSSPTGPIGESVASSNIWSPSGQPLPMHWNKVLTSDPGSSLGSIPRPVDLSSSQPFMSTGCPSHVSGFAFEMLYDNLAHLRRPRLASHLKPISTSPSSIDCTTISNWETDSDQSMLQLQFLVMSPLLSNSLMFRPGALEIQLSMIQHVTTDLRPI